MDEPDEPGGSDQGPNPLEAILAALNSCTATVMHLVAQEMGLTLRGSDLHAEGDLDPLGFLGQGEVKPHFLTVRQRLILDIDGTKEQLAQLRQAVAPRCPAFKRIRDAGVHVAVERGAPERRAPAPEGAGGRRCGVRPAGRSGAARLRPGEREEGG